jgi:hypothetical protein
MKRTILSAALLAALAGGVGVAQAQIPGPGVGGAVPSPVPPAPPVPGGAPEGGPAPAAPGAPGAEGAEPAAPKPIETLSGIDELGEARILQDRAERSLKNRDWGRAVKDFEKLVQLRPEVLEFRLNFALSLYELGKDNEARDIYEKVLSGEPDNIQALNAVARLFCKQAGRERDAAKKTELEEQAREQLKRAARNGLNALRAIKIYPEFGIFKTDVQLQLDLIREPQQFRFEAPPGGKDPFYNPLPTVTSPGGKAGEREGVERSGLTAAEQKQLVERLENLFNELEPLVAKNDFQGLGKKWGEIDEIRRSEAKITSIDLLPKFKELMKRHREKLPVVKSLLLQAYFSDGEQIVDQMRSAYDAPDLARVFELWARLEAHAKKMKETDQQFAQPADDLIAQGKPILEKAQKLKEIEQIKLAVTAVVTGGGISQAIVNNRIVSEGDQVFDAQGTPIAELRVVQIKRRKVKFVYKGLEFEPKDQLRPK